MTTDYYFNSYVLKFIINGEETPFIQGTKTDELFINRIKKLIKEGWRYSEKKPIRKLIKDLKPDWGDFAFNLKKKGKEINFVWAYPSWLIYTKSKKDKPEFIKELGFKHDLLITIKKKHGKFKKKKISSKIKGIKINKEKKSYEFYTSKKIPHELINQFLFLEFNVYTSDLNAKTIVNEWNNNIELINKLLKIKELLRIHEPGIKGLMNIRERLSDTELDFDLLKNKLKTSISFLDIILSNSNRMIKKLGEEVLGDKGVLERIKDHMQKIKRVKDYLTVHISEVEELIKSLNEVVKDVDEQNEDIEQLFNKQLAIMRTSFLFFIMLILGLIVINGFLI